MSIRFFFSLVLLCAFPGAHAQIDAVKMEKTGSQCIAAFHRDAGRGAELMLPPLAFCTCVGEYVATSTDDTKKATDRAGIVCMQVVKGQEAWARGFAKGMYESCEMDASARAQLGQKFLPFCHCFSKTVAASFLKSDALGPLKASSIKAYTEHYMSAAIDACAP